MRSRGVGAVSERGRVGPSGYNRLMDPSAVVVLFILVVAVALLGVIAGWSAARSRAGTELSRLRVEEAKLLAQVEAAETQRLELTSRVAEQDALSRSLIPLESTLKALDSRVQLAERERAAGQSELLQVVHSSAQATTAAAEGVRREAHSIKQALHSANRRGTWGEQQLTRLVESAGMVEHVHFSTQSLHGTSDGVKRPDLTVHLAGGRSIAVDAKAPMKALLEPRDPLSDTYGPEDLAAHAKALRAHVDTLGGKAYWRALDDTPEFVVMFLPAESMLSLALTADPGLMEFAFGKQVVLATPTTLLALLRTVGHAWRQEAAAESARQIRDLGVELYERLQAMTGHLGRLGRSLDTAVSQFNKTVGSFESRVLVSARRFSEMGVAEDPLDTLPQIESASRSVDVAELASVPGLPERDAASG